jgi:tetratricopeptide (TPR) repeat protein
MGVRARDVVSGQWVAVALIAALGLAALVFLLVPQWLSPTATSQAPPQAASRAGAAAKTSDQPPSTEPAGSRGRAATEAPRPQGAGASAREDPAAANVADQAASPAAGDHGRAAQRDAEVGRRSAEPAPRVDGGRAGGQFDRLMTQGLAQLERREWSAAEQSFRAALGARAGDAAAADGLARAQEGLQRDALAGLRREAQALESAERWEDALAAYRRASAIDPTVDFARDGIARSERMIALRARIDGYLAAPARLYSPRVREEAQQLLASLEGETSGGPRLAQAKTRLAAALARAETKVTIRLASDNATEVTLYRVGPLGRFQDREVALTPGTYTLVGSRPGYKDVRVELTVDPDAPAPRIFIACEERV